MISLNQVALRRGPRKLLDNVTMTLSAGQRVGIVGRNGTGKSSLFSLILGEIDLDAGDLHVPAGLTIANVSQEITDRSRSALDYVLDGDPELRAIQSAVSEAEAAEDDELSAQEAIDEYEPSDDRRRRTSVASSIGAMVPGTKSRQGRQESIKKQRRFSQMSEEERQWSTGSIRRWCKLACRVTARRPWTRYTVKPLSTASVHAEEADRRFGGPVRLPRTKGRREPLPGHLMVPH